MVTLNFLILDQFNLQYVMPLVLNNKYWLSASTSIIYILYNLYLISELEMLQRNFLCSKLLLFLICSVKNSTALFTFSYALKRVLQLLLFYTTIVKPEIYVVNFTINQFQTCHILSMVIIYIKFKLFIKTGFRIRT